MKREIKQQIRNQMIKDIWETHKAEWEMSDLAFIFNKSIPQIYRIIKVGQTSAKEKQTKKQN